MARLNNKFGIKMSLKFLNVDVRNAQGRTALMDATLANNIPAVATLIRNRCQVNLCDEKGKTALHYAAYHGFVDIVLLLVKNGALVLADDEGRTPLHYCTGLPDTRCIDTILKYTKRDDITTPDKDGLTALHWAVIHNQLDHVRYIAYNFKQSMNSVDILGRIPLLWAYRNKGDNEEQCIACATILIEENSQSINFQDLEGRALLHLACVENNMPLIRRLLSIPTCKRNLTDFMGRTPMHCCALGGYVAPLSELIQTGSDLSVKDRNGATPLHYASAKNHGPCVSALLEQPNAPYKTDSQGLYPLHWAVVKGHVQSVSIILSRGKDPNAHDATGNTGNNFYFKASSLISSSSYGVLFRSVDGCSTAFGKESVRQTAKQFRADVYFQSRRKRIRGYLQCIDPERCTSQRRG
jgi:ankyrin repeat protein